MLLRIRSALVFAFTICLTAANVFAAPFTVSSVGLLAPNPNNINILDPLRTNLSITPGGTYVQLTDFRNLIQGDSGAFSRDNGGVIDAQQIWQGGSFPANVAGNATGVTLADTFNAPLTIRYGSTQANQIQMWRDLGATPGTGIDSNVNQNFGVVSGGGQSPAGGGTGTINFATGIFNDSTDTGATTSSGAYIGIQGGAQVRFVFNDPTQNPTPMATTVNGTTFLDTVPNTNISNVTAFAITQIPRASQRTFQVIAQFSNGTSFDTGPIQYPNDQTTGNFVGIQAPAGSTIASLVLNHPQGGVTRYDDIAFITTAPADLNGWSQAAAGSWDTAANWATSTVPNSPGAAASFRGTLAASGNVTLDGNKTVGQVVFVNAVNSYTITPGSGGSLTIDNTGDGGTPTLSASTGNHTIGVPVILNNASTQLFAERNASLTVTGNMSDTGGTSGVVKFGAGRVELAGNNTYGGNTTINLGTLVIGKPTSLPGYNAPGRVAVNAGGTLAVSVGGVGEWTSADIDALVTNATFGPAGTITPSRLGFDTAAGNFTHSSTISGAMGIDKIGANELVLSGTNTYTGPTRILEGTLTVDSITNNMGTPANAFSSVIPMGNGATGATFKYTGAGETLIRIFDMAGTGGTVTLDQSGSGPLVIGANGIGGTTLATSRASVTSSGQGSKTLALQGSTTGTGELQGVIIDHRTTGVTLAPRASTSLVKDGTGTWILAGANTYTGGTVVNGGTLRLSNTTGSATGPATYVPFTAQAAVATTVTVNSGGVLGGTGSTASAVTVNTGGGITPGGEGVAAVGTLTFNGALNMGAGSIFNYEFSGLAQPNDVAVISTANALTLNGGGFNLYQTGTTDPFSLNGVYNVIGYQGTIGGTGIPALSVLNPAPGKAYTFGTSGGFITLQITPGGVGVGKFWDVDANGNWTTPAPGTNWTTDTAPNGANAVANFGGGGTAITAPRTVTLDANQEVGVVSFDSENSFSIVGASTLTLTAPGDASVLNNVNGSHSIGVPLAVSGDTLVNVLNVADTLTISGPISGNIISFAKVGQGTVVLSGNNTYSATNTISTGTVRLTGSGKLGDALNALNMSGGTLDLTTTSQTLGAVAVAGGDITGGTLTASTLTYTGTGTSTISSVLAGGNSVSVNGTGAGRLVLTGTNTFSGGLALNSGVLSVGSDDNLGASANFVNLSGGTLQVTGTTFNAFSAARLPNVAGYNSAFDIVEATNTFTIDPNGATGGSALTKLGAGTLRILGTNAYLGDANASIRGGTLDITGNLNIASASTNAASRGMEVGTITPVSGVPGVVTVNVAAGATLDTGRLVISGTLANGNSGGAAVVNVEAGATLISRQWLAVGNSGGGTGTLNLNGNAKVFVNQQLGTRLEVANFNASSGVLNINGTAEINLLNGSTAGNNGDFVLGVNGTSGSGTVNQNGGTVTFFSDAGTTSTGATSALRFALGNSTGTYTYHLNAGVLNVPNITGNNNGTRNFNFNGGLLVPTIDNATFIAAGALSNANVRVGGAKIDTGGHAIAPALPTPVSVTIAQNLIHEAALGATLDGGLTVTGAGVLTLTGSNTFTGDTTVGPGANLVAGSSNALQASKLATIPVGGTTGLQFSSAVVSNAFTIGGFNNNTNFLMQDNAGTRLLLSVGGGNTTSTYSGVLSGTDSSLTKVGNGILTLTGNNTYTGPTAVNAGSLRINGVPTGSPAYNVNSGGTLGGTGTIAAPINVASGGLLNPGAGIGTLNMTGAVSVASGGFLNPELQGTTNDVLNFGTTGTLTYAAGALTRFTLLGNLTKTSYVFGTYSGTNVSTTDFGVPTFAAGAGVTVGVPVAGSGTITNNTLTGELILNVTPQSLRGNFNLDNVVDAKDITAMLRALTDLTAYRTLSNLSIPELNVIGDFNNSGNATTVGVTNFDLQLMLNYIAGIGAGSGSVGAVPEPSTIVLLGLGGLGLALCRRRSKRANRS